MNIVVNAKNDTMTKLDLNLQEAAGTFGTIANGLMCIV